MAFKEVHKYGYRFKSGEEADYADYLEYLKETKEILEWEYETIRFKTCLKCNKSYTPDFIVKMNDGSLEIHEYKGRLTPASSSARFRALRTCENESMEGCSGENEGIPITNRSKLYAGLFWNEFPMYIVMALKRTPKSGGQVGTFNNCKKYVNEIVEFKRNSKDRNKFNAKLVFRKGN